MLQNKRLANKQVFTMFGPVKFDERGIAKNLTDQQERAFGKVRGFVYKDLKLGEAAEKKTSVKQANVKLAKDDGLDKLTILQLKNIALKNKITIPSTVTRKAELKEVVRKGLRR